MNDAEQITDAVADEIADLVRGADELLAVRLGLRLDASATGQT